MATEHGITGGYAADVSAMLAEIESLKASNAALRTTPVRVRRDQRRERWQKVHSDNNSDGTRFVAWELMRSAEARRAAAEYAWRQLTAKQRRSRVRAMQYAQAKA